MNVTVLQNSNASFTCVLNSNPAPLVQWYFISSNGSSQLITSGGQYTVSNLLSSGNYSYTTTLFISSITFQNTGDYQCTGSNSVGDPSTSLSTLTVFGKIYWDKDIQWISLLLSVPPTITLTGPQIPPNEGESLSLICTATDSFPGLSISWFKDNEPLASGRRVEISTGSPVQNLTTLLYTTTSNLRIHQVGLGDEGIYTCRTPPVNTILSSVSDSFNITVQSKSMI